MKGADSLRIDARDLRFGDVEPGNWFDTPKRTIAANDIDRFAELTGDRFEIHMEDAAARSLGFKGRVAHGLLVLSIVDGLKNQSAARFAAIASLGWDWRFSRPVLIGDAIGARITVIGKRRTKDPSRGILTLEFDVINQIGETVQKGTNLLMVQA